MTDRTGDRHKMQGTPLLIDEFQRQIGSGEERGPFFPGLTLELTEAKPINDYIPATYIQ